MKPEVLLSVRNLSASYGSHRVWGPLSFTLAAGERVGLAGASGAGKSTLLEAIAGLRVRGLRLAGEFAVEGRAALLPQGSLESLSPFLRVRTQVPGRDSELPRPDAWPHELSGGERQRVLLEQALAQRADLLAADEPFAHLDPEWQRALAERLRATSSALLIASHDESVFARLGCTRVIRLSPESLAMPLAPAPTVREGEALRATGLAKTYAQRDIFLRRVNLHPALRDANLVLARGETVALRGPSGAGKSTLARCLAGRETPDAGVVDRKGPVQLAPQDPTRSLDPRRTVADALAEAGATGEHLELVALDRSLAARRPGELSEGQRARVALVRTMIAAGGGVLILDESLAPLDTETRVRVLLALREQQAKTGLACLLITHDDALARAVAHRECHMAEGRLL